VCREGGDVAAKKGARIVWALDGRFLIVSGFSRQSERQIVIYQTSDLRYRYQTYKYRVTSRQVSAVFNLVL
jgi:coronin-7